MDGQTISLVPPPLLITWSSHLESVTDILYVDIFQLVVSAGLDGDVKVWKLSGDAIGMGAAKAWPLLSLSLTEHTLAYAPWGEGPYSCSENIARCESV